MGRQKKVDISMPEDMTGQVFDRPDFLDRLVNRGDKAKNIIKISEALKAMDANKCLAYTFEEFDLLFGDHSKTNQGYIKSLLKANGIQTPRLVVESSRIYIWCNDIRK